MLVGFVLLATATIPGMAKGKDPKNTVVKVETFEVVQDYSAQEYMLLNPEATAITPLADACQEYRLGRQVLRFGNIRGPSTGVTTVLP